MTFPTAQEQYFLELVNRARADPNAETALFGIGLNDNLASGTISGSAKTPLAFVATLNTSADTHSLSMLTDNYFSHTGSDGSTATQRMLNAGWDNSGGAWSSGENISLRAGTGVGYNASTIESHHAGLFRSAGHRTNILNETFHEIGIGQIIGTYTANGFTCTNSASMATQNFGFTGRAYLTGVVIDDLDGDSFYDIGEGQGGVTISVTGVNGTTGSFSTTTWDAGGYTLELAAGSYNVEFSGGGLSGTITKTVTIGNDNMKIDAFTREATNVSTQPITGDNNANVLTGSSADDTIIGSGGNDTINGGAGVDTSKYAGEAKHFSVTITKNAATTVTDRQGTEGTDSLTDVEKLDFTGNKDVDLSILSGVVNISAADLKAFIEIYIAYFNRAPDAEGLFYWGTRLSQGMSKEKIAESFYVQPETQALYTNPDDTEGFVTAVYNNFLGRAPDTEGFNYWVNELNTGSISKPIFLLAIINGAKAATGSQADVDYFTNKANIGAYYSVIKGMSNTDNAKTAMALYDGSQASITNAKNQIDTYYNAALDANNGELLINLVGVMDDPFAVV